MLVLVTVCGLWINSGLKLLLFYFCIYRTNKQNAQQQINKKNVTRSCSPHAPLRNYFWLKVEHGIIRIVPKDKKFSMQHSSLEFNWIISQTRLRIQSNPPSNSAEDSRNVWRSSQKRSIHINCFWSRGWLWLDKRLARVTNDVGRWWNMSYELWSPSIMSIVIISIKIAMTDFSKLDLSQW